ncbi:MFS transporter [Streptomyces sp. MC1]|uniref:MFS transporter n=1 Tax=Streptomyces sp. MC1 TaxID=295105 RepID=UPI0027DD225A|nr:MFS transporter [Streptomyces sp. MC1]
MGDGQSATSTGEGTGRVRLPGSYLLWLVGVLASLGGNTMFYFALGWAASAHGGAVTGIVLSAVTLPRVLLLLIGGVVSDRVSTRRVLITGDAAMLAFSLLLALIAYRFGAAPAVLIAAGAVVGVANAFYLPASASMPRRLVAKEQLPRALSLRQVGGQVVNMAGGPLGGVLVGLAGLVGATMVNAATFAVVLVILIVTRPRFEEPAKKSGNNILRDARDGIRLGASDPILRPSLILTGAAAGFLLPVLPLLLPLLARGEHWGSGTAGLVVGAQGLGMITITLGVVRGGPLGRPGLMSACGLVVAGLGVLLLAVAPALWAALGASFVIGAGNGLFSAHIVPLVLMVTPDSHISRIQSLLTLVQSAAVLVMNYLIGNLAVLGGVTVAFVVCAVAVIGTGLLGLASSPLRTTRTGMDAAPA